MKAKLIFLTILLSVAGCSFIFGSPSSTVKAFVAAAKKGDSEAMTKLFSSKALQREGADKVRSNNQNFAEMSQRAHESGGSYNMNQLTETRTGNTARVSFFYQNDKHTDSLKLVFDLSKEGGEWKIDDIGGADKEQTTSTDAPASGKPSEVSQPPPPPVAQPSHTVAAPKTISAGVLNGKATSLPKPAYPPAARAVKASGTVVVQVTLDETGRVVSASAVSGHPLLRSAAVAAANSARFSPTLLSGKPVKVTGVITYNFVAE